MKSDLTLIPVNKTKQSRGDENLSETFLKEYFEERFGYQAILFDTGFIFFKILSHQFYIAEFHIGKSHRQSLKAFLNMMSVAKDLALDHGCTEFSCHVQMNSLNADKVLRNNIKYGFKVIECQNNRLGLVKNILE